MELKKLDFPAPIGPTSRIRACFTELTEGFQPEMVLKSTFLLLKSLFIIIVKILKHSKDTVSQDFFLKQREQTKLAFKLF